ncbi:MAG TPA: inositol monophosphatase [Clostridia bacterium]|jgi:myo-inositol-1(or 4)-monophosphatase|nr:inositol monophosphatase [Clostridia bacterium]
MLELNLVMREVKSWVREVGEIQKENFRKRGLVVTTKSTAVDFVTEIDRLSEKYILEKIRKNYPNHDILAEESGDQEIDSDYLWVVDPLDGTTNYMQGIPIFAVSIALKYKKETVLGVVYLPMLDLLFEGVKDKGAYLNGEKIRVAEKDRLDHCILATGFPYDRAINKDNNANYFAHFVPRVRGLRRMGSAAYDLANVAAGILDGYWEINLAPWDVAAGILILEEAGGKVIYLTEKRGVSLVAGNPVICEKILEQLRIVDERENCR